MTTLFSNHLYFISKNMTTYANIKLNEIFALYGNPFTRGSFKKNFNEKILKKHYNKVDFEEEKCTEIKKESNLEENSHINLLNNNNENNLLTLYQKKPSVKFGKSINNKFNNSKFNLNTDAFSMYSQKKRTQQELIKKTLGNFSLEEFGENTKMSSMMKNKKKIGNINSEKL